MGRGEGGGGRGENGEHGSTFSALPNYRISLFQRRGVLGEKMRTAKTAFSCAHTVAVWVRPNASPSAGAVGSNLSYLRVICDHISATQAASGVDVQITFSWLAPRAGEGHTNRYSGRKSELGNIHRLMPAFPRTMHFFVVS